jgi:type IV secretion system protein VirD4
VLTALLHAAALAPALTMDDVLRWVSDPDSAQNEVAALLRRSPEEALGHDARQFLTTNDKTRSSITSTIMPALGWLHHDAAAAAATGPRTGGAGFDVTELLASRATVYLLGAEETQTAPLVSALTGHIAREARRIAAFQPGGRLDPPLTLALDEAALICPVPLHQWTADMGGRGVTIIGAFQSRAQLLDRYGEARAEVILNNSGAVMVFGGTRSREDLTYWSTLGGERDEPTLTTDMHGRVASRTTRRVPVLAPAQIANLPAETVVAFRRGMPPVIGRVELAYRRLDVRAHQTPDAWTVRARLAADAVRTWLLGWLGRHVGPACGVPFGIWAGVRWIGWLAAQIDPSWSTLGALLGIVLGGVHGWFAGAVVATWREPVWSWLVRRWRELFALLGRLRRATHYRPRDVDPITQPLTVVPARDDHL